jgi:hypothetical protein
VRTRFLFGAGLVAVVVVVAVGVIFGAGIGGSKRSDGQFPEGVYRYRLTAKEVLQIAPSLPAQFLSAAIGTFTWTIRDGTISLAQTGCECSFSHVSGKYTIAADRLTVRWPKLVEKGVDFCSGDCTDTVRWSYDGAVLRLVPVSGDPFDLVFWGAGKPWVEISSTS